MSREFFGPIDRKWLETTAKRGEAYDRGQRPDLVPIEPRLGGHCAYLFGISIHDFYANPSLSVRALLATCEFYGIQPGYAYSIGTIPWVEDYGGKIAMPTGYSEAPYIEEHPLKAPEDIDKLEVKDLDEISKGPTMTRHWEALETGRKLVGRFFYPYSFPWEPYGIAANWLGFERLLVWTARRPELIHKLMRKVVEHSVNVNLAVVRRYGGCSIFTGSVYANSESLSPKQIQEFHIDYLKEMVERSLKHGAGPGISYHLCGDHSLDWHLHKIVPLTPQTRLQVGGLPADLHEVIALFGKECVIVGNVPTALLEFGTPREVYEESKRQLLAYKNSPRGFVLAPACDIPSQTPPGNVHAMVKAVQDYGTLSNA